MIMKLAFPNMVYLLLMSWLVRPESQVVTGDDAGDCIDVRQGSFEPFSVQDIRAGRSRLISW
ncbi:MAG: hypothetical protein ACR2QF_17975 [Geminicoccaceae bacterium]